MGVAQQYDFGKQIKVQPALVPTTVPSSSGAVFNGATINRATLGRRYYSCRSFVKGSLTGSTQQAATLALAFQHSSDGTSWDNYSTGTNASAGVGSTASTGAQSAVLGIVEQTVNLNGARQYIRQVVTASFALTTSGDNAVIDGGIAFGGADELPSL